MKRLLTITIAAGILAGSAGMAGCAHTPNAAPRLPQRAQVLRALDTGQTVFALSLAWAEMSGADQYRVAEVKIIGNAAIRLLREAVQIDLRDADADSLQIALTHLRAAVDEALVLAAAAGVSDATLDNLRGQIDAVWPTLETLVTLAPG